MRIFLKKSYYSTFDLIEILYNSSKISPFRLFAISSSEFFSWVSVVLHFTEFSRVQESNSPSFLGVCKANSGFYRGFRNAEIKRVRLHLLSQFWFLIKPTRRGPEKWWRFPLVVLSTFFDTAPFPIDLTGKQTISNTDGKMLNKSKMI